MSATRTSLICEWHRRFGFALNFFESRWVIRDKIDVSISVAEKHEKTFFARSTNQYSMSEKHYLGSFSRDTMR